ncbi:MAG: diguanylate cyclase response regulator [Candidatus Dactylopiibacterium carminicum]|uniref:diguanylate cyclase n=1 Tax=Candidatus Dactylopiibacterium carminicum TaxID=857335 RepID=A0A272EUR5_9RHOO|nr:diguanylate cyclase [Candidatus Dactylopiibacterium carminicum]KAF7600338.1 diguanylate cyclase response regulator [Candidatus Dactylopiibacterium carminicum]PAS93834.1 MAG: diguanylate cyclase response regulator [Candidatus Dactylopiibacterium carminicum]PAS95627.1 MAG: diguanylate cyclase response regulator [Candidatus Dactylopiibacterium carminicum]PAT00341.1 MAG: diguanylate cyclase response regulator [Candidatus Dactylopiibacterium carminicum]
MKALVIDDMLTSATVISHQLRCMGIEPLVASDGPAGIELFKELRPELILLDVQMPGMDGFETARRLRQLERDGEWTPIIFLASRASDEELERAISVGSDDFLVKPVSEMVLTAKVRAMQRISQMRHSLVVLTRRLDEANRELLRLSLVDGLTGVANRRQFDESLRREWARGIRTSASLSLLMCDVDCFKQYNDRYGHQRGDECLRQVSQVLESGVRRPADLIARYGGEEFVAILPDTELDGALSVAEEIRSALEARAIPHDASPAGLVTLSIGAASVVPRRDGYTSARLLADADAALYRAKQAGRNRVHAAVPGEGRD